MQMRQENSINSAKRQSELPQTLGHATPSIEQQALAANRDKS
jgi:hypothetical protein